MTYKDPWVKKAKWLTQALILSGTLNVGLLSTFIYLAFKETKKPLNFGAPSKKNVDSKQKLGAGEILAKYQELTFQDLLLRLSNKTHVESGCSKRDLALAVLVDKHHFNLEKALGGLAVQKRVLSFSQNNETKTLTLFPDLADYQFEAIVSYAKTEKWPLTAEGLYKEIQSMRPPYDPSLLEAFYLTPEYHFISLLFSKTSIFLKKEHIAILLAQSKWPVIHETCEHLSQNAAFTVDERRRFLLQLAEDKSRLAAKIFLETDQEYCLKQFDNDQVLFLCNLLGDKASPSFLKELLKSPRTDEIWKKAASILYEQAAETIPENLDLAAAKRRFIELKAEILKPAQSHKKPKTYIIKTGDSLWKIAKGHNITVKALKEANDLKTDKLKPGESLKIP